MFQSVALGYSNRKQTKRRLRVAEDRSGKMDSQQPGHVGQATMTLPSPKSSRLDLASRFSQKGALSAPLPHPLPSSLLAWLPPDISLLMRCSKRPLVLIQTLMEMSSWLAVQIISEKVNGSPTAPTTWEVQSPSPLSMSPSGALSLSEHRLESCGPQVPTEIQDDSTRATVHTDDSRLARTALPTSSSGTKGLERT